MAELSGLQHAEEACRAHSDLNGFYAVIALMENGLMSADSHADQMAIIDRCKRAAQKCLRRYDRHLASLKATE